MTSKRKQPVFYTMEGWRGVGGRWATYLLLLLLLLLLFLRRRRRRRRRRRPQQQAYTADFELESWRMRAGGGSGNVIQNRILVCEMGGQANERVDEIGCVTDDIVFENYKSVQNTATVRPPCEVTTHPIRPKTQV